MASAPLVVASLPSPSLFRFPLNPNPTFIPPPPPGSLAFAPPFEIPDHVYTAVLDPRVPLTIAAAYAVTVKTLNRYNRSTNKKPWAVSKTAAFRWFVVLHNVFLAVYSAWTFYGMVGALHRSIASPFGPAGLAATADSFCKLNGAPGLGNAAFFDEETDRWQTHQHGAAVDPGGPSRTQPGRLWNEGLAFYGWIFYLSKFYEVLDTFIILAKGKFSSTLQTYHHAGAMLCMWAGMRYMSAPIWLFATFNSAIHAMMYTYYTVTAFRIRVPMLVKRSLTTLQITQFLVGASYAMAHSFISYTIPVAIKVSPAPAAASAASASAAAPDAPAALLDNIRNLILGAAAKVAQPIPAAAATTHHQQQQQQQTEQQVTYGQKVVPCITASSQTFAIWLNVLYLAPLTYLFVSFFIASYIRRSTAENARVAKTNKAKKPAAASYAAVAGGADPAEAQELQARRLSNVTLAEKAGWDAARGLEKEVYGESSGDGSAVIFEDEDEEVEVEVEDVKVEVETKKRESSKNLSVPAKGANGKAKGSGRARKA